jgi:hypothetical protein
MNNNLMKLMSVLFTPQQQMIDNDRGGSDWAYMSNLIVKMVILFKEYNIQSIFDAGCNDCRIGKTSAF